MKSEKPTYLEWLAEREKNLKSVADLSSMGTDTLSGLKAIDERTKKALSMLKSGLWTYAESSRHISDGATP